MSGKSQGIFRLLLCLVATIVAAVGMAPSSAVESIAGGEPTISDVQVLRRYPPGQEPEPKSKPNILIIMTDDQRRDSMEIMPKTMKWMADQGTQFTEGYVTTPSCCPSRASVLTGQYNHNNGVLTQDGPAFDENTSIASYLSKAGYATAFVGKYVHYLDINDRAPHWDRWTYFKGGYYDVLMNIDGNVAFNDEYSTTVAFDTAVRYVDDFAAEDPDQPWMMSVWTTSPHRVENDPPIPEPKYRRAAVPKFVWDPQTFEADVSDKPPFIYCCPGLTSLEYISKIRAEMIRSLYSVDDGVDQLLSHLEETGELDNTLVIYLGDNGWLFGDHNLHEKFVPYENSVGVPYLMRWPGEIEAGLVSDRYVSNIDILPTALAAAGVEIPANVDGHDLLSAPPRQDRYTEYFKDAGNVDTVEAWRAVRSGDNEYIEWYDDNGRIIFREFYNRALDPHQLQNLLGDNRRSNDPSNALLAELAAKLDKYQDCIGSSCP